MNEPDTQSGAGRMSPFTSEPVVPPMTFIVRLSATAAGRAIGIVEHPGTGRKERFEGLDGLAEVIAALSSSVGGPRLSRVGDPSSTRQQGGNGDEDCTGT